MATLNWVKELTLDHTIKSFRSSQAKVEKGLVRIRRGLLRRELVTINKAQEILNALPGDTLVTQEVYSPGRFGHTKNILRIANPDKIVISYWITPLTKYNH